jgi:hypothetical protein
MALADKFKLNAGRPEVKNNLPPALKDPEAAEKMLEEKALEVNPALHLVEEVADEPAVEVKVVAKKEKKPAKKKRTPMVNQEDLKSFSTRATQETIDLVGMAAKLSGRPIYEVVQMSLEAALLDPKARQKLFKEPKLEILDTILGR